MAMWLSRMASNGINDNHQHIKHQKFKPSNGISQCYSFYCPSLEDNGNSFTRRSYDNRFSGFSRTSHDITSIQHTVVTEGLYRQDLISSLINAGVSHIAIKVPNISYNLKSNLK